MSPVWFYMAHQDIVARYRRTTLGPWWITLGTGVALTGMAFVWSSVFGVELKTLFPYMTSGYIIWMFIASILTEGTTIFISSAHISKTIKMPFMMFVFSFTLKNAYIFMHNAVIVILALYFFDVGISLYTLLVIPGLLLLFLASLLLSYILGVLGARYRDIPCIVTSLVTFIFLLTPIMWDVSILKGNAAYIAYLNPVVYFLSIIRDPLLNKLPSAQIYLGAVSITAILFFISSFIYSKSKNKLIYWI